MEISGKTVFNASYTPGDPGIKLEIEGKEIDQMQMLISAMSASDHIRAVILAAADFWRDPKTNMIKQPWKIGMLLVISMLNFCSCKHKSPDLYINKAFLQAGGKVDIDSKDCPKVVYMMDDSNRIVIKDSFFIDKKGLPNIITKTFKYARDSF